MFRYLILCLCITANSTNVFSKEHPATTSPILISITVNAGGAATVSGHTYLLDNLHTALQTKMWNKYLSTGKMQDKFKLRFSGEVLMGVRGASMDEILLSQTNTLKKLCMKKYGKEFDQLSAARQTYIKTKFPILFQTTYI